MVGEIGSPIKEYISSTIQQIKDSLPEDARVDGIVNIEIFTIIQQNKEEGVGIKVVNFGADAEDSRKRLYKLKDPAEAVKEMGK